MFTSLRELQDALTLGESQISEFKESPVHLEREMVGFANASGGTIFCGVADDGTITGTPVNNKILSQIQDLGRNCDPPVKLIVRAIDKRVLAVEVLEGDEKG